MKGETDPDAVDIVCFGKCCCFIRRNNIDAGHLLFEMAMGYELESSAPDLDELVGKCPFEVIEVWCGSLPCTNPPGRRFLL